MKKCSRCGLEKELDQFGRRKRACDGLQSYCIPCRKAWDAQNYVRNKDSIRAANDRRRQEILVWLQEYKSTLVCQKCGQNHPATLDFHHRDRTTKDGSIGDMIQNHNLKKLKEEIAKCDVLCSNCHRILHWEERNNGPVV